MFARPLIIFVFILSSVFLPFWYEESFQGELEPGELVLFLIEGDMNDTISLTFSECSGPMQMSLPTGGARDNLTITTVHPDDVGGSFEFELPYDGEWGLVLVNIDNQTVKYSFKVVNSSQEDEFFLYVLIISAVLILLLLLGVLLVVFYFTNRPRRKKGGPCRKCGTPAEFDEQFGKWYCKSCERYVETEPEKKTGDASIGDGAEYKPNYALIILFAGRIFVLMLNLPLVLLVEQYPEPAFIGFAVVWILYYVLFVVLLVVGILDLFKMYAGCRKRGMMMFWLVFMILFPWLGFLGYIIFRQKILTQYHGYCAYRQRKKFDKMSNFHPLTIFYRTREIIRGAGRRRSACRGSKRFSEAVNFRDHCILSQVNIIRRRPCGS